MNERFKRFFTKLLLNEGGYSNDPLDSGGKTIYGITKRDYPDHFHLVYRLYKDGKTALAEQAASNFYFVEFYNPLYENIKDEQLAFRIFDFSVNAGKKRAVKILQRTINKSGIYNLDIDGIFGEKTLEAVNNLDLNTMYVAELKGYYISLNQPRFIKGWLNRLKNLI